MKTKKAKTSNLFELEAFYFTKKGSNNGDQPQGIKTNWS